MPQGSKRHIGAGAKNKGHGSGAMTDQPAIAENAVLSNRDKAQDSRGRGQDSKHNQVEQMHDSELNQNKD